MNQQQLAVAVGEYLGESIHPASVSGWERGDTVPTFDKLVALGVVLDLSIDEIVHGITGTRDEETFQRLKAFRRAVLEAEERMSGQREPDGTA